MDTDAFNGRLLQGERIVWSGRPAGGLLLTGWDIVAIPFSIFWCGFMVFWEGAAIFGATDAEKAGPTAAPVLLFPLFGLPFICVGLFMVIGRFWLDAWIRARVRYALTDQRALIARSGPFRSFTSLYLERLPDVQIKERGDGRGTIVFGQRASLFFGRGYSLWLPSLDATPQFLVIENPRQVFDLIQHKARSRTAD